MNRAAIYCRLSKEDMDKLNKGDESESIKNQKLLLMDYAIENGFSVNGTYIDEDYSGLDSERPDFKRLIRDAKHNKFDVIICKTQSRFTRDIELVEKYIHREFQEWGIRFIGVLDNIDTMVKGNKKARQINGLINEWYCEDLSENIRAVFKKKMKDGQFIGPFACYGYKFKSDFFDIRNMAYIQSFLISLKNLFDFKKNFPHFSHKNYAPNLFGNNLTDFMLKSTMLK